MFKSARRRQLIRTQSLGLVAFLGTSLAIADTPLGPRNGNPIVPGYFADPCIRKFGDTFYLYVTPDGWGVGQGVPVIWTSKDFVNWTPHRTNWPSTAEKWAPSVVFANGKYYMFNSVPCQVWVATSDTPLGPWKNAMGEGPMIRDQEPKGTITLDGELFQDTDGKSYLAYGTWWTPTIVRLKPDLLSFDSEPMQFFKKPGTQTPNGLIKDCMEAPYIVKRNGVYYLMYSDLFCGNSTYQVKYSTASSPFGPWTYGTNNPILSTNLDNSVDGPGHHGLVSNDSKDYIIYHRHDNPHDPDGSHRQVCADILQFGPEKSILPVKPTHRGIGFLAPSTVRDTNWVIAPGATARANASSSLGPDFAPQNAADINNGTLWKAADYSFPQWLSLDLGKPRSVKRAEVDFMFPGLNYRYRIEYSLDGKQWKPFIDRSQPSEWRPASDALKSAVTGRYFRVTILGDDHPERPHPETGIWNVRLYDGVDKPFGAPLVRAGAAQTCPIDVPRIVLQGEVLDLGLPCTSMWKKLAGPGQVSFADPTDPNSVATFSKPGVYTLALTANNRVKRASAEVKVTVLGTPRPELLAYDFEEPNDTRVLDLSTSAQHGTLASDGDVKNNPKRADGLFGKSLFFDGFKSYVVVPGLGRQRTLTATLWAKFDQLEETTLFATQSGTIRLGVNREGHLEWQAGPSQPTRTSETDLRTIGIGRWTNVGIQHDAVGQRIRFVVNGKAEAWHKIDSTDALDLDSGLRVGASKGLHFAGKLDQLRFYRTLLSDSSLAAAAQPPARPTIADALRKPDGTRISLAAASVTYAPRGGDGQRATTWFVVGDADRGDSLLVRAKGDELEEDGGVTLTGLMRTDAKTGTRFLEVSSPLTVESAPIIRAKPLDTFPNKATAKGGEFVQLSGTVEKIDTDRKRLTLSDASGRSLVVTSPATPFNRLIGVGNTVEVRGVVLRDADGLSLYVRDTKRTHPAVDPLEDGLVAYYRFDKSAADEVNSDRPVTLRHEAWAEGHSGGALELNGRDADVSLPDIGTYRAITFAAWVNPTELRPWQGIFHTNQFEPNRKLHLSLHEDGTLLIAASGNGPVDYRTRSLFDRAEAGTWKHLAVAYDSVAKQIRIYVNGELLQQFKYTNAWPIALTGGMRLGSWNGGDRFFHGKLDEVRFYGRALSEAEVRQAMAAGSPQR